METYEELKEKILITQAEERQHLIMIKDLYNLAQRAAEYYNTESGTAHVVYYAGNNVVTLRLDVEDGKHPLREALILIDEIFYPEEYWVKETQYPTELRDEISWSFALEEEPLYRIIIFVRMKKGGGCKQVGTGRYQEVMEWRCD